MSEETTENVEEAFGICPLCKGKTKYIVFGFEYWLDCKKCSALTYEPLDGDPKLKFGIIIV